MTRGDFVKRRTLCPICKTGQESLMLDERSSVCPYLGMHNGKKCRKFVRIKRKNILKTILKNFFRPQ